MEKYSVREVIEQAVQTEKLGFQFYSLMSEKFRKDAKLNELLCTLAAKEAAHEKIFSGLMDSVPDEEPQGWEEVSSYLRALVESEFFLGKSKSLPSLEHVKTAREAANFALGFEKETLLYYHAIRDAIRDTDVIDKVIREERTHIKWLTEFSRDFLASK